MPPDGDENMTNEPKVYKAVIITLCHDSALVTTKSDVDAGLDNGVIEAVDEREGVAMSELATGETCEIPDAVSTALLVERIERGDRPPLGQRIGPQIADPTLLCCWPGLICRWPFAAMGAGFER